MDSIQIRHPGTGRIAKIEMLPMSLWESQESNGKISLRELFNNLNLDIDGIQSNMTGKRLIEAEVIEAPRCGELVVKELTLRLMEERGLTMKQALDTIYNSETYTKILDLRTSLFSQSTAYVYSILETEILTGKLG